MNEAEQKIAAEALAKILFSNARKEDNNMWPIRIPREILPRLESTINEAFSNVLNGGDICFSSQALNGANYYIVLFPQQLGSLTIKNFLEILDAQKSNIQKLLAKFNPGLIKKNSIESLAETIKGKRAGTREDLTKGWQTDDGFQR